ncbi:hypothetical protein KKC91_08245 [bacterium]|nr:hypothetical protein [bacterium]
MGEKGSYVFTKDKKLKTPAYKVKAIDTTGAGDCFIAGFLTGIIRGWQMEKTARFANAVGALATTATGATSGVKSFRETLEFMRKIS